MRSIFDIMDFSVKENIPGLLIFWIFRKLSTALNGIFLSAAYRLSTLVDILFIGLKCL